MITQVPTKNSNVSAFTKRDRVFFPRLFDRDFLMKTVFRETLAPIAHECEGTVVDYGCGSKPFEPLFDRATAYVGTDMEVSHANDLRLREDFSIPLEAGAADVLTSFFVLEHVPEVASYLRECARATRPDGRLILVTHGIWAYHPCPGHYEDYWRWTESGLARTIEEHGFEVTDIVHVCDGWLCLAQQWAAISDPWVKPYGWWRRRFQYAGIAVLNCLALTAYRLFATRPAQRGDIMPICYIMIARRKG
jgi:SAM-dependent methyltransferase